MSDHWVVHLKLILYINCTWKIKKMFYTVRKKGRKKERLVERRKPASFELEGLRDPSVTQRILEKGVCLCFAVWPELFVGCTTVWCWSGASAWQGLVPSDRCHLLDVVSAASQGSETALSPQCTFKSFSLPATTCSGCSISLTISCQNYSAGEWGSSSPAWNTNKGKVVKEPQGKSCHSIWYQPWEL